MVRSDPQTFVVGPAEARLFDIELDRPRIAIVIEVNDPSLTTRFQDPSGDREIRLESGNFTETHIATARRIELRLDVGVCKKYEVE